MATFREKVELLRGLGNGEIASVGPFFATLDVTRRCNLQCPGCLYHSAVADGRSKNGNAISHMPPPLFAKICDELQTMGTVSMTLSGEGEPFLHPHILDLIAQAKAKGFTLSVFSNGTLINESVVNALIDSQLDLLRISFWATSKKDYQRIYSGSHLDNFDRVLTSLHLLATLKARRKSHLPRVRLHQPIDRRNYNTIGTLPSIAEKTGCDMVSYSPFRTWNYRYSAMQPTGAELGHIRQKLTGLRKDLKKSSMDHNIGSTLLRYEIGAAVWKKLPCYIGWLHTRIKINGDVLPCNSFNAPVGNLQTDDLAEIWNQQPLRRFRKKAMTRKGLAAIARQCNCKFCCYVPENSRVHRLYRWIDPMLPKRPLNRRKPHVN